MGSSGSIVARLELKVIDGRVSPAWSIIIVQVMPLVYSFSGFSVINPVHAKVKSIEIVEWLVNLNLVNYTHWDSQYI